MIKFLTLTARFINDEYLTIVTGKYETLEEAKEDAGGDEWVVEVASVLFAQDTIKFTKSNLNEIPT